MATVHGGNESSAAGEHGNRLDVIGILRECGDRERTGKHDEAKPLRQARLRMRALRPTQVEKGSHSAMLVSESKEAKVTEVMGY